MTKRQRGLTMIEVLIAMIIVSILASVAIPSYISQLLQSRRAEGHAAVHAAMQAQERFFARFGSYTPVVVGPGECVGRACGLDLPAAVTTNGYYALTAVGDAVSYSVTVTAMGPQLDDLDCRTMTIDNRGIQSATDASGTSSSDDCW